MMDTKEQSPVTEIEHLPEETKKYNKHIDDLIENAEIEAEMEAEKKIRSKNSRVFSISMFGIGLLALVYLQVNSLQTPEAPTPVNKQIETAEDKLAKQVPIVEDGSSNIPVPELKNIVAPAEIKLKEKALPTRKPKASSKIQKKTTKSIIKPKTKIKTISTTNTRFFVQTGAFSSKKNAEVSMKKLQAKGFSPLTHVVSKGKTKTYLVQLGVFSNKEKAKLAQEKLARAGYPKTIIK
ncbi:MAG: cell division protein FtsN [Nitrospinales bacterium]|jgi:cell division protein FtsN